jgi:hypothetical protein
MSKASIPIIKRYFSDNTFIRIHKDFGFLVKFINSTYGEYYFAIREDYFNIYYKGNSLAKIIPTTKDIYKISIHSKFFENTKADNAKYFSIKTKSKDYTEIELTTKQLHPFLQKKHLLEIASNIKKVNFGEEISFEQTIITDNLDRNDLLFIDRQINDKSLNGSMDLLALRHVKGNQYKFIITEVKLGKNPELKDKVASQSDGYLKHVQKCFRDYKLCYEKQYVQKKELGLIDWVSCNTIEIIEPVEGLIVVGGYSGIAHSQIKELKIKFPNLKIEHLTNRLK